jgi:hypothetical protein
MLSVCHRAHQRLIKEYGEIKVQLHMKMNKEEGQLKIILQLREKASDDTVNTRSTE